jgi:CheY-like chemotaxis protein
MKRLVSLIETYLNQSGFRVVSALNGLDGLSVARRENPDLIILDIMMPEMDGYEFMRLYRMERNTPIILLTARVEDEEKVVGLELGADDYVTKPFRPRELMARVKSVLRRSGDKEPKTKILRVAEISLDRDNHIVRVGSVSSIRPQNSSAGCLDVCPRTGVLRLDLLDILQGVRYKGTSGPSICMSRTCAKIEPTRLAALYRNSLRFRLSFMK